MRLEHIDYAPVEALHHAFGSWRSGLGQAVLNVQGLSWLIKLALARGLARTRLKEPVGELLAVVG
jgi:hypothetical protein